MPRKKRITKKVLFIKTIETVQPMLNLSDWKIIIKFTHRMRNLADCDASPEYKEACIRVNTTYLKKMTYNEIISTAIHEMIHCIVWPLAEWAESLSIKDSNKLDVTRKLEESLVTNLEKVMMNLIPEHLQNQLNIDGYADVNMIFEELEVLHG